MCTLVLSNPAVQTVGDFLSPARSSQQHQNIEISGKNGRLLENQLMVGLVFYDIMRDIPFAYFTDTVIIMPDYTMEEICDTFAEAYKQAFKSSDQENSFQYSDVTNEDIKEEVAEEFENPKIGEDNTKIALVNAEKGDNAEDLKHMCTSCNYRARRRDTLNQHIKRKHVSQDDLPVYGCEKCSYASNVIENFRRHMKDGCRSKSVICPLCEKRCLTKDALRTHKRRHHKQTFEQNDSSNEIVSTESRAEFTEYKTTDTEKKTLCEKIVDNNSEGIIIRKTKTTLEICDSFS